MSEFVSRAKVSTTKGLPTVLPQVFRLRSRLLPAAYPFRAKLSVEEVPGTSQRGNVSWGDVAFRPLARASRTYFPCAPAHQLRQNHATHVDRRALRLRSTWTEAGFPETASRFPR